MRFTGETGTITSSLIPHPYPAGNGYYRIGWVVIDDRTVRTRARHLRQVLKPLVLAIEVDPVTEQTRAVVIALQNKA